MVAKERDIAPIVAKCVDAIEEGINDVNPEGDTSLVAEKYKVNHFKVTSLKRTINILIIRFLINLTIKNQLILLS